MRVVRPRDWSVSGWATIPYLVVGVPAAVFLDGLLRSVVILVLALALAAIRWWDGKRL